MGCAMVRADTANLIRLFDFYLACMALFSLLRRFGVYRDTFLLLVALRGRWPRLMARVRENRSLLLNWEVFRPLGMALALMTLQLVLSRLIWPAATIRPIDLLDPWPQAAIAIAAFIPMLALDVFFLVRIGRFDRGETVKYLDMAEGWAGTLKARLVSTITFGKINPERMVEEELHKGLEQLRETVSGSLWWVTLQVALRTVFGLTVWLLWAAQ
jgi:hypothetical protein